MPGSWPHGPNFYTRATARAFPGPMPAVGVSLAQHGYARGTPARFGGDPPRTYAAQWQGDLATPPARTLPEAAGCNPCEAGANPPGWERTVPFLNQLRNTSHPYAPAWWMRDQGAQPREAAQVGGEFAYVTDVAPPVIGPPLPPGAPAGPAFGPAPTMTEAERARLRALAPGVMAGPGGMIEPAAPPPTVIDTVGEPFAAPRVPATVAEEPTAPLPAKETPWGWIVGGSLAAIGVVGAVAYVATRPKRKG